jgi:cytidylate kinase
VESQSKIIIAIDGFSSCGKSTLAKTLAANLDYAYIDSGAMYRAVTLYFIENEVDIQNETTIKEALAHIFIQFKNVEGRNCTFLNSRNVEDRIREMDVSNYVSPVSALPAIRRALVRMQQAMGKKRGIVMDGRDIGTVVFTDAELKVFMTADKTVRAERRLNEIKAKGNLNMTLEEVSQNLEKRDYIDSNRDDSPLRQAEDAKILDNTLINPQEQLDLVTAWVNDILRSKTS